MNIFFLSKDPKKAAKYHCCRHITKMPLEYFQLLSAAHKVLDGEIKSIRSNYRDPKTGKRKRMDAYVLADKVKDRALTKVPVRGHAQHPCAIWARKSSANYEWLYRLFVAVSLEYYARYGKHHNSYTRAAGHLGMPPANITIGRLTQPPQAMPEIRHIKGRFVEAYRNFYRMEKRYFVTWKTSRPAWYDEGMRPTHWYDKPHKHLYRIERNYGKPGRKIAIILLAPVGDYREQMRKYQAQAKLHNWGQVSFGFLFSLRADGIEDLKRNSQRNGQENRRLLREMIEEADDTIIGWDHFPSIPKYQQQVDFVKQFIKEYSHEPAL